MEITNKNFNQELENINNNLKRSCFIGFDAEYTAILSGESFKHRLFDTNEERYDNLKSEVCNMTMTQVGLTMFQYNRDQEAYSAVGYTFHLCPHVFGRIDQRFIFQASTLRFLCKHNFDFNKFIYEGLPYLNKEEEKYVRKHLKEKSLSKEILHSFDMDDERKIQNYCSEVSKWLSSNNDETMYIDVENPVFRYLVHVEIRQRFPEVLTTDSLGNSNKVLIYRHKNIEGAVSAPIEKIEESLMKYFLGFSQIIELLSQSQKPVIGHNVFLDTILLHNQFIGPLPKNYATFKANMHNLFPKFFDTKYISHEMGKKLTFDEVWKSNALQDLYEFFSQGKCKKLEIGMNFVRLKTPFNIKQSYHEAGWDSYCSGYCFIRLGHWAACESRGKYQTLGPASKLAALTSYCNKVNVIRGAVPYMNLVGKDPPSHRPDLLHLKSMKERTINIGKITSTLASFGSVDVKPYGSRTALIAANTKNTAEKILNQFKNDRNYKITRFSRLRHSAASRMVIWSGALLTGSIFLFLLRKKVNV